MTLAAKRKDFFERSGSMQSVEIAISFKFEFEANLVWEIHAELSNSKYPPVE